MQLINFTLVKHPMNWLTIILMLFIAAIGGTLILEAIGVTPATASSPSAGQSPAPDDTGRFV
jgi:hypothetical protein